MSNIYLRACLSGIPVGSGLLVYLEWPDYHAAIGYFFGGMVVAVGALLLRKWEAS